MENSDNIKALFIIVNAGFGDEAVEIARDCGAGGATIINARGTGHRQKSFLGINVEPEKEIIISLVQESAAAKIMDAIKERTGLQSPANGISFYLPVDKMTLINKFTPNTETD
jgi:nitrogen regulatory protein PII